MTGCVEDPEYHSEKSKNQVITDYIATNSDKYSEFGKLLNNTELNKVLSIRGPFTLLLPTNDALKPFVPKRVLPRLMNSTLSIRKTW
jgi:uncharacterized surface protein with fasciclin (FAS1) repeats